MTETMAKVFAAVVLGAICVIVVVAALVVVHALWQLT